MAKQVADLRPGNGMDAAEGDEQHRRWKPEDWPKHQKRGNYNPTMVHLNFEIVDGVIQPVNTADPIPNRFVRRLAQLGIEDPNLKRVKKNIRTLGKIIFGGSRDRMQEMAFGHAINHSIDADFSNLKRTAEIEQWAKGIYDFVCKEYGRDNVLSFVVHLDELNPHIHASILPISKEGKLSYKDVFLGGGQTKEDCSRASSAFHTRLHDEVNYKYGLDRGDPVVLTGAEHRTTEEYRRDLNNEVKQLETKIKSFRTMLQNLENQYSQTLEKIADAQEQFKQGEITKAELDKAIAELNATKESLEQKIELRKGQLKEAEAEHEQLTGRNQIMQDDLSSAKAELGILHDQFHNQTLASVAAGALNVTMGSILKQKEMSQYFMQQEALENTDLWYLTENWGEIATMISYLLMGGSPYDFVPSSGGGGSSSDLRWDGKRKDDETDIAWATRCARTGIHAHKKGFSLPGGQGGGMSGGRGGGRQVRK